MSLRGERLTGPTASAAADAQVFAFEGDTTGANTVSLLADGEAYPMTVATGQVAVITLKAFARVFEYTGGGAPTTGDVFHFRETYFFYNEGSGVVQVGGLVSTAVTGGDFAGSVAFDLVGSTIGIEATGDTDENANWVVRVEFSVG